MITTQKFEKALPKEETPETNFSVLKIALLQNEINYSTLSDEERGKYAFALRNLQELINLIQSEKQPPQNCNLSLCEVLQLLKIRKEMMKASRVYNHSSVNKLD